MLSLLRRSPRQQEQRAFEAYQASDPHLPSHFKGCSPLALPRDELDGRLKPASDRLLNAGDAVVLFGDVIHGAPAVPAGVWRLVLFVSAYMSSITCAPPLLQCNCLYPWRLLSTTHN